MNENERSIEQLLQDIAAEKNREEREAFDLLSSLLVRDGFFSSEEEKIIMYSGELEYRITPSGLFITHNDDQELQPATAEYFAQEIKGMLRRELHKHQSERDSVVRLAQLLGMSPASTQA